MQWFDDIRKEIEQSVCEFQKLSREITPIDKFSLVEESRTLMHSDECKKASVENLKAYVSCLGKIKAHNSDNRGANFPHWIGLFCSSREPT